MTTEPEKKNDKGSSVGNLIGGGILIVLGISGIITVMSGRWKITHIHDVGTPCISLAMIIYGFILFIKGLGTGIEGLITRFSKNLKRRSDQKKKEIKKLVKDSSQKPMKKETKPRTPIPEKTNKKLLEKPEKSSEKPD